ncbi:efflux RND transporter periplasmic adaptor subunit [Denitromonas sp.]|uniref:efflux RND transporter periplasmic adaptor subunit n=1 Tax=Denitromonas sp. TaxID=2734609 RepID=UPI002B003854|nr:efflux RND transporter periplasmic adaptor subunit [Denitromonas sp.]
MIYKKQAVLAAAIVLIGGIAGTAMLGASPSTQAAQADRHGEASAHADEEHHGEPPRASHADDDQHADGEHHETASVGVHGGQVFSAGDTRVEFLLSEEGGRPHFRMWSFDHDRILAPGTVRAAGRLVRADGSVEELAFTVAGDYLKSTTEVAEPHVFNADISVEVNGEKLAINFVAEEGKVELTDAQIDDAGVIIEAAAPAKIKTALRLPGEIRFNEDRTAHVVPRLGGLVERVPARLGQSVKRGEVLAVIASTSLSELRSELLAATKRRVLARSTFVREKRLWEEKVSAEQDYLQAAQVLQEADIAVANAQQKLKALGAGTTISGALNRYEIRAPFDGVIVEKHLSLGEAVKEDTSIFTISDLSSVWAEIVVPARDLNAIRVGEQVTISATAFESRATGTISYVGALFGQDTRTAKAQVTLPNPDMAWRPGLFVNVDVISSEKSVPVSVATEAVHTINEQPVVFIRTKGGFVPQPVTPGNSDGTRTEIVEGLKAGTPYAAAGSFVVKAELGKGSAEHSH